MENDKIYGIFKILEIANKINTQIILIINPEDVSMIKSCIKKEGILIHNKRDSSIEELDRVKIRKDYSIVDKELNNVEIDYDNDVFLYIKPYPIDGTLFHNIDIDNSANFVLLHKLGGEEIYLTHINNLILVK